MLDYEDHKCWILYDISLRFRVHKWRSGGMTAGELLALRTRKDDQKHLWRWNLCCVWVNVIANVQELTETEKRTGNDLKGSGLAIADVSRHHVWTLGLSLEQLNCVFVLQTFGWNHKNPNHCVQPVPFCLLIHIDSWYSQYKGSSSERQRQMLLHVEPVSSQQGTQILAKHLQNQQADPLGNWRLKRLEA